MYSADQGCERLRWRPWPCTQCSRGVSPVSYLIRCIDAGAEISAATPEEVAAIQVSNLLRFVSSCAHPGQTDALLPRIAEGSEHLVYFDARHGEVLKITRAGVYGESYYLVDKVVNQKNCSPLEYLLRLRIWKKLFQSAPSSLGITDAGQIVSKHKFVSGELPTQVAVDSFLEAAGFTAVRKNRWLWKKQYPGEFDFWLGDARTENFVQTPGGIVPIDIRLWQASSPLPAEPQ